ncbi:MAG: iron-sulfur cluster repair protein YtfE [Micavibrio aeruginosavorus]|nr:iron-sulfur cluster repair protein YtfE [Micavibrio aeruginosavorus]
MQLNAMTLGEIAAQVPGATAVFRRYDLDFCCAGNQLFAEALARKGLDRKAVIGALETLSRSSAALPGDAPGIDADDETLIDYIITRFHDTHREQFPELIRLAGRVEKVHAAHPLCPKGLEAHLTAMFADLSAHMEKEERILFPMLCNGERAFAAGPIAVMESEHEFHGRALMAIRDITHGCNIPDHACNTWRALHQGLARLEEDLIQHIHLENNILFAR